jgi:hypothetical protein
MYTPPVVKFLALLTLLALQPAPNSRSSTFECQSETATLCTPAGCEQVAPTIKLYMGEYDEKDGSRASYYLRCRRDGGCDRIDNPWVGESGDYRVFVAREQALISRIAPDDRFTDVATLEDRVLILRGSCWAAPPPPVTVQPGK